jgi:hypothetical protein
LDFLVAGLGFGALLVLAGYATREFGVFLFVPARIREEFAEDAELAAGWRGLCRVAAIAAMIGGLVMWLALSIAIGLSLSDRAGAYLVASLATVLSFGGAALIWRAFTRMHQPAATASAATSAAEAGWLESDIRPEDNTAPFESWKPRIIPKPSATIVDDMPTWGAVYEHPLPDEAHLEPFNAEAQIAPVGEVLAGDPGPDIVAAEAETMVVSELPAPIAEVASVKIELEIVDSANAVEPIAEAEITDVPDVAAPAEVHADVVTGGEPEPEPVDPLIAETVVVAPLAEETGARRFKSALLSNLDEPGTVEVNAKFKSSILADLSAVRLPDDGPRFRSTTLVDLAPPDEVEVEASQTTGAANRRR